MSTMLHSILTTSVYVPPAILASNSAVSDSIDTLHRTMNLFKGVMQRIGNR